MPFDWMTEDGKVVLIEKAVRTVPYGFLGVLFSVYLSQLGLDAFLIGAVLALTVASSAIYTLVASVFADLLGRRRTLIFFALTDAVAGALLFSSNSLWAPVAAGIIGNMTVGAGEVGPFLTLEQAILPGASDTRRRTLGFSVYNLVGYVSSSAGALLVGLPQFITPGTGGYRPLFMAYLASGLLGAYLYSRLSIEVEKEKTASPSIGVLSEASKPVVRKLSALFALDSFGGGFIGISILSYYFYEKYSLQLSSLGVLFAGTQIVTAISFLVAERIARQIGLIKTMVYTHIPSNLLLAIIPFVSSAPIAIGLLLSRQSLSQMDVPTRQSYLMSVVPETDRTPAAGFTNVSRSIAQTFSPSIAGYTIATLWLGSPFVIAGGLKLVYDLSLYKIFHRLKPPQEA
ncbi:MFS transporter [Candidatus Bathyarchaeota archaeon]|nr:MAG: MFS transporter [Candidatus Bathyarchaeota archaeon]